MDSNVAPNAELYIQRPTDEKLREMIEGLERSQVLLANSA